MNTIIKRQWQPAAGLVLVVLVFAAYRSAAAAEGESHPNVILFLVDDLGWMDLSCQGSEFYETPHIDRLARQGIRFTSGYAACAVCSPTRAAVQTGRYPARLGVTDWIRMWFQTGLDSPDGPQPPEYEISTTRKLRCPTNRRHLALNEVTMAEALKAAGYVCGHVGKWHLGQEAWYPERQGYDFNRGGCDLGLPGSYFDPYDISVWRRFPLFKKLYNAKLKNIPTLPPRRPGEYLTDRLADEAVGFIKSHRGRPFFLNICTYAVHTPLQAKRELIERYAAKPRTRGEKPVYAAMIHSVDDAVGRILATLDELKLTERTVVIFTSDNGGYLAATSNAPLRSGKGHAYEGGIRVPWIVRWPGVTEAGTTSDVPISSIDLFPTILQITGAELPDQREVDGVSLVPLFKQTGTWKRDALYWHYPHYWSDETPYSIIRSGDWKLIKHYEGPTFELYNLANDLGEKDNLAPSMPERVRELHQELAAHLEAVGAKLPKPNVNRVRKPSSKSPMAATVRVDFGNKVGEISPLVYGGGFEHVGGAVNLGLDAQMLEGRSFEEDDLNQDGVSDKWLPAGWGDHAVTRYQDGRDRFHARHAQVIRIDAYTDGESGVKQKGLFIEKGRRYVASFYLKGRGATPVRISLATGDRVHAEATIATVSARWQKYTVSLVPGFTTADAEFRLMLASGGLLQIDQVSLIPEDTYQGHGTRKDIVEKILDIGPTVIRWPGGWFAEVYRWKHGIGNVDQRPLTRKYYSNVRNRHNPSWEPNSFGTDEFIQFCRDIKAEPLLTVNSGYDPRANLDELVKEAAQWVEYCNGDETTKFGALRKANGHPAPYDVNFWNVGNEVFEMGAETYARRFLRFAQAMRAKDPSIKLIAECGRSGVDPSAAENRRRSHRLSRPAPLFLLQSQELPPRDGRTSGIWKVAQAGQARHRRPGPGQEHQDRRPGMERQQRLEERLHVAGGTGRCRLAEHP